MKILKAVFYGPFAIAVFLLTMTILFSGFNLMISPTLALALIIFGVSIAGNIVIGIPTYLVLKKLNIKNGFAYILTGFIAPALIMATGALFGNQSYRNIFSTGLIFGCFGAFCAYVFWLYTVPSKLVDDLI